MPKDSIDLVREVLIALRKKYSQEQINRLLKAKSNQVARWESGHTTIDWISFCDFCVAAKAPLKQALKKHLFYEGNIKDQKELFRFLGNFYSVKILSQKIGLSISQTSRLLSGKTPLTLLTFFRLADAGPYSLTDFLAGLTSPHIPQSIKFEQERIFQEKELHYEYPWIAALILYLNTDEYQALLKHSDQLLARKLKIPATEICQVLQKLESLQIIEKRKNLYYAKPKFLSMGGLF